MGRLPKCALDLNCISPPPEPKGSIGYYTSRECPESLLENHMTPQPGQPLALPSSEEGTSEISGTLSRDWVPTTETGTTWVTSTAGTLPRGGYLSDPSSQRQAAVENSKGFAPRLHKKAPKPRLKRPKDGGVYPGPWSGTSNRINPGTFELPVLESLSPPPTLVILRSRDIIRSESRQLDVLKPLQ